MRFLLVLSPTSMAHSSTRLHSAVAASWLVLSPSIILSHTHGLPGNVVGCTSRSRSVR